MNQAVPHAPGPVAWMANNHVAANLLMAAIILGGVLGLLGIRQQVYPDFSLNRISVTMAYPGASPEEVETGIILAIENELQGMVGIDRLTASAGEGSATVIAWLAEDAEDGKLLQDIRNAVSRITSFPDDAEPAQVSLSEHNSRVIDLGVAGDLAEQDLFNLGERVRQDLLAMPGISEVDIRGGRQPEIIVEMAREQLRALDLTLGDVASTIRQAARDIPAGGIETRDGEVLLRTEGRRERASAYADIPLKTLPDGSRILLGDVAKLVDGFTESSQVFEFNGQPGLRLDVYQTEDQDPIKLAARVRAYVDDLLPTLPPDIGITIASDRSERFSDRIDLLLDNGAMGLALVILALGAFLNLRLAFWVCVSIPVVFIGTFVILPGVGISLNMISLFAFILTLGIVVDDAIIVGENIYAKSQAGLPIAQAVAEGAREMIVPVLFAVGTNIIAFIPLMYVPGATGQFLQSLPIVAVVVFLVSLVEALFILPAHLNHGRHDYSRDPGLFARFTRFHDAIANSLDRLRDGPFMALLRLALRERYITAVLFGGLLALVIAWYQSGRIDLSWRPEIPGVRVDAELDMPTDASLQETLAVVRKVEAAGLRAIDRLGSRDDLDFWFTRAGWRRPTYGDVNMYLVQDEERDFTQEEFTRVWREEIGDLPEVKSIFFEYLVGPGGNRGLGVNLSHTSAEVLEAAARELAGRMSELQGVVDVADGVAEGKRQIAFTLTEEAKALGLSETSLGRQIRNAFHGVEALRLLRGGNEVKVRVRLPKEQRVSLLDLKDFLVRAPDGTEIPMSRAALFAQGNAYSKISREDGKRIINVSASVDKAVANTRLIRAEIENDILPEMMAMFPGLEGEFSGSRRSRTEALDAIFDGLLWVILAIFALMAALFRSYSQALIVMLTIPFASAAAIAGHIALGFDLSSMSVFGMIALCGLVVNGALVLTVRLNETRAKGDYAAGHFADILEATRSRFRPIVLTSLTTTAGLFPMLFESSTQAQFLVPMAIALSFGTVASTLVVLLLIPALYGISEDLRSLGRDVDDRQPG